MGHGTIFVYSILSVLELSEVLWGMVLYLCTVSCLLQNCLRCCGAWYYICIQYPVCSRTVEVLWGMVLYLYTVSCLSEVLWGMVLYLYTVSCLLLELSEVLWGMVLYLYTVSCLF